MVDEEATFGMYDLVCDFIDVEILSDVLTGAGQDTISVQRRTDPPNNVFALFAIKFYQSTRPLRCQRSMRS